jgi:hypothetical protein
MERACACSSVSFLLVRQGQMKNSLFWRRTGWLIVFLLTSVACADAQSDNAVPSQPSVDPVYNQSLTLSSQERQELIKQSRTVAPEIQQLVKEHKYVEAEPRLKEFLSWQRKLVGEKHPIFVNALAQLSEVQMMLGKMDESCESEAQVVELRELLRGKDHWQTVDSRQTLRNANAWQ